MEQRKHFYLLITGHSHNYVLSVTCHAPIFQFRPDFMIINGTDKDGIGGVLFIAFFKSVRRRDGKEGSISIEVEIGDGSRVGRILTYPLLVGCVPNINESVTTSRGEGAVSRVEGDSIDGVEGVCLALALSVTFEGVFLFLNGCRNIEILDGHPTLDRAESVARVVRKATHTPCLVHQRRLANLFG